MAAADPGRTRDRVLFQLKTRGPQSAGELAERLDVTPMAVRQHLASLASGGLVQSREERRPVGRPVKLYSLTESAAERFPDRHADLTVELLGALRKTFGEEGVDRLVAERGKAQLRSYRERMPPRTAPLEARVAALAELRSEEGYLAEWRREGDGFLLLENHCPICAAATVCQGLCRQELELFRAALGKGASVERTEHALAGARRCAYRITPR